MDRITIEGVEVFARHGVLPDERERGQMFRVDVSLDLDLAPAAASDELEESIDYGVLAGRVAEVVAGGPYDLIETVAGRVLDVCLQDVRVQAAEVVVHKPQAPLSVPVQDVRVSLRRARPVGESDEA